MSGRRCDAQVFSGGDESPSTESLCRTLSCVLYGGELWSVAQETVWVSPRALLAWSRFILFWGAHCVIYSPNLITDPKNLKIKQEGGSSMLEL